MKFFRRNAPALLASIVCCLMTAELASAIVFKTHGIFVYPLDDSYIHLAVARTLAVHHVWGMGPWAFASASSSPGWTLLLAGTDLLFGTHLTTAVYLNLVFGVVLLFVVEDLLISCVPQAPLWLRYVAPLVVTVGIPLPNLILLGMEHVAQALSILLLVAFAIRVLVKEPSAKVRPREAWPLIGAALFAGAIRYEAVFPVMLVFALLVLRRRIGLAVLVALASAVAPVGFALYSHRMSGFLLPFSVLVKMGQGFGMWHRIHASISILLGKRHELPFLGFVMLSWVLRLRRRPFWQPAQLFLLLTVTISMTHLLFAPIGWLMRYESYLVCLILLGMALVVAEIDWSRFHLGVPSLSGAEFAIAGLFVVLGCLASWNLVSRAADGEREPVQAAVDRFDEHIQMARFVKEAYDHDAIAMNDIGAVSFYTDAKILDMDGLGSVEPLLPKRRGRHFDVNDMQRWADAEGAAIAIVQETPKERRDLTPPSWRLVQVWQQPTNVVFGDDLSTSFFAVRPGEMKRLCDRLDHFSLAKEDKIVFNACPAMQVASVAGHP